MLTTENQAWMILKFLPSPLFNLMELRIIFLHSVFELFCSSSIFSVQGGNCRDYPSRMTLNRAFQPLFHLSIVYTKNIVLWMKTWTIIIWEVSQGLFKAVEPIFKKSWSSSISDTLGRISKSISNILYGYGHFLWLFNGLAHVCKGLRSRIYNWMCNYWVLSLFSNLNFNPLGKFNFTLQK
jgi:hypothetical protein